MVNFVFICAKESPYHTSLYFCPVYNSQLWTLNYMIFFFLTYYYKVDAGINAQVLYFNLTHRMGYISFFNQYIFMIYFKLQNPWSVVSILGLITHMQYFINI